MSWKDEHLFKYGSWERMMEVENWCDKCKHPDGYHHLCQKGKCGCSICKDDAVHAESEGGKK